MRRVPLRPSRASCSSRADEDEHGNHDSRLTMEVRIGTLPPGGRAGLCAKSLHHRISSALASSSAEQPPGRSDAPALGQARAVPERPVARSRITGVPIRGRRPRARTARIVPSSASARAKNRRSAASKSIDRGLSRCRANQEGGGLERHRRPASTVPSEAARMAFTRSSRAGIGQHDRGPARLLERVGRRARHSRHPGRTGRRRAGPPRSRPRYNPSGEASTARNSYDPHGPQGDSSRVQSEPSKCMTIW